MGLPSGYTSADLVNPLSDKRQALDGAMKDTLATSLTRAVTEIVILGYTVSGPARLLAEQQQQASRDLQAPPSMSMTFQLMPNGTPNNVPASELSARLAAVNPTSPLVTFLQVSSCCLCAVFVAAIVVIVVIVVVVIVVVVVLAVVVVVVAL